VRGSFSIFCGSFRGEKGAAIMQMKVRTALFVYQIESRTSSFERVGLGGSRCVGRSVFWLDVAVSG
jgi:hypothetical protein